MASKIRLRKISLLGNQLIINSEVFRDIKFEVVSESASSTPIEDLLKTVLDYLIPLASLVAYLYYLLPNKNSKLSVKEIKEIENIATLTRTLFLNENPSDSLIQLFMSTHNKFILLDLTREQFRLKNIFIFDDLSTSHNGAFKVGEKIEFPKNNILLKFKNGDSELRMGISMMKEKIIQLINIDKKKVVKR